jgi:hypothetical protein
MELEPTNVKQSKQKMKQIKQMKSAKKQKTDPKVDTKKSKQKSILLYIVILLLSFILYITWLTYMTSIAMIPPIAFSTDETIQNIFQPNTGLSMYNTSLHEYEYGLVVIYSSSGWYGKRPLILTAHGRGTSAISECESWINYANEHGAIIVCPSFVTSNLADIGSLFEMRQMVQIILDWTVEIYPIDLRYIMFSGHSAGGYIGIEMLYMSHYITMFTFRSSNYWNIQGESIGEIIKDNWISTKYPISTFIYWGEKDHQRIKIQSQELVTLFSSIMHVDSYEIPGGEHDSRVDIAGQWFNKQIKLNTHDVTIFTDIS